jgi:hypothetical protein
LIVLVNDNIIQQKNPISESNLKIDSGLFSANLCFYVAGNLSPIALNLQEVINFRYFINKIVASRQQSFKPVEIQDKFIDKNSGAFLYHIFL